jgi:uncharacterized membrane protein YfcA
VRVERQEAYVTEWLPIVLALIATGIVAGLVAGLLGVGGGIVVVPVLFFVFQLLGISAGSAMLVAVATSLLTIVATSLSSVRSHYRRGNVLIPILQLWAPFIVLGVVAGVTIATSVGGVVAIMVFGLTAIAVALNMLLRANAKPAASQLPGKSLQALFASAIGAVSSIMGIGGGSLGVPILTAFNTPVHKAVGTSAVFGFIIALPSAVLFLLADTPADAPRGTVGLVNLFGFVLIAPLSMLMAPVGVSLGARLNAVRLKQLFALFLLVSGARMVYQALA